MKLIIYETVSVHRFPINFLLHLFLASGVPVRVRYTLFSTLLDSVATAAVAVASVVVAVAVAVVAATAVVDLVVIVIFLLLSLRFFFNFKLSCVCACVCRVVFFFWGPFHCVWNINLQILDY